MLISAALLTQIDRLPVRASVPIDEISKSRLDIHAGIDGVSTPKVIAGHRERMFESRVSPVID